MIEPPVPLDHLIPPVATALVQHALELEEDATSFNLNPTPNNWDEVRRSLANMERVIGFAKEKWGL
jgi:hypothetical protein